MSRTNTLRTEYRAIRSRSAAAPQPLRSRSVASSPAAFDAAVRAALARAGVEPSPEAFVRAARTVRFPCPRCAGTGQWITRVENGQPAGPGGECYRCAGRGTQSDADARRNYGADRHMISEAFRAMCG